jgi:hypothetical protein
MLLIFLLLSRPLILQAQNSAIQDYEKQQQEERRKNILYGSIAGGIIIIAGITYLVKDHWGKSNAAPVRENTEKSGVQGQERKTVTSYTSDGKIKSEYQVKDGKKDGYYKEFYSNGKCKVQGNYGGDKKNGIWTLFWEDGREFKTQNWINDVSTGDNILDPRDPESVNRESEIQQKEKEKQERRALFLESEKKRIEIEQVQRRDSITSEEKWGSPVGCKFHREFNPPAGIFLGTGLSEGREVLNDFITGDSIKSETQMEKSDSVYLKMGLGGALQISGDIEEDKQAFIFYCPISQTNELIDKIKKVEEWVKKAEAKNLDVKDKIVALGDEFDFRFSFSSSQGSFLLLHFIETTQNDLGVIKKWNTEIELKNSQIFDFLSRIKGVEDEIIRNKKAQKALD